MTPTLTIYQMNLERDRHRPERWTFDVRVLFGTGLSITIRHCLMVPTAYGWEVRMPADREQQPILSVPRWWKNEIRDVIEAEIAQRVAA